MKLLGEQELKYYLLSTYRLAVGKRIRYTERSERTKEHLYEVKGIYKHCILLEDTFDHTRICPCYSKLSMMMRGIE